MSNELEELGEYVLMVLEKMKTAEKRLQKLEDSVDDINKLIEEATEEATEENSQQTNPSMPSRFWLPLNAVKWVAIFSALYWIANIVAREQLVAWNNVFPADWEYWIILESIFAGISIAVVIGIEVFLFSRIWRTRQPKINSVEEIEETQPEAEETAIESPLIEQKAK